MTSADFTVSELEGAIRAIRPKKAPGLDSIRGDMLKHLGAEEKRTLLTIFNQSRKTEIVPNHKYIKRSS